MYVTSLATAIKTFAAFPRYSHTLFSLTILLKQNYANKSFCQRKYETMKLYMLNTKASSVPCKTSKMELFAKNNSSKWLFSQKLRLKRLTGTPLQHILTRPKGFSFQKIERRRDYERKTMKIDNFF